MLLEIVKRLEIKKLLLLVFLYIVIVELIAYLPYINTYDFDYGVRLAILWFLVLLIYKISDSVVVGFVIVTVVLGLVGDISGMVVYFTLVVLWIRLINRRLWRKG